MTGTSTVTIIRFFTAPTNRFEYCGSLVENTLSTIARLLRGGRLAASSVTEAHNWRASRSATMMAPSVPYYSIKPDAMGEKPWQPPLRSELEQLTTVSPPVMLFVAD